MQAALALLLKGGSGSVPQVQLRAALPEGKLSWKEKALELGNIPVGVPQTTVATLRNLGSHDGIFQVRLMAMLSTDSAGTYMCLSSALVCCHWSGQQQLQNLLSWLEKDEEEDTEGLFH